MNSRRDWLSVIIMAPLAFLFKDKEARATTPKAVLLKSGVPMKLGYSEQKKKPQIRLWKLGDLEKGIYPGDKAFERLADILAKRNPDEDLDIIWGPDISVQIIDGDEMPDFINGEWIKKDANEDTDNIA